MNICMRRLIWSRSISSDNDEMTYCILVLVEDQGRGSPVGLKRMTDSIVMLTNTWHDDDDDDDDDEGEVDDGRMFVVSML